jgi:hypothetical protein
MYKSLLKNIETRRAPRKLRNQEKAEENRQKAIFNAKENLQLKARIKERTNAFTAKLAQEKVGINAKVALQEEEHKRRMAETEARRLAQIKQNENNAAKLRKIEENYNKTKKNLDNIQSASQTTIDLSPQLTQLAINIEQYIADLKERKKGKSNIEYAPIQAEFLILHDTLQQQLLEIKNKGNAIPQLKPTIDEVHKILLIFFNEIKEYPINQRNVVAISLRSRRLLRRWNPSIWCCALFIAVDAGTADPG